MLAVLAFVLAPSATAGTAPPKVTLAAPGPGYAVPLDGRFNPVFGWNLSFSEPPAAPTTISFEVSTDPSFEGWKYVESRDCAAATPACFTGTAPHGIDWLVDANGGAPFPPVGSIPVYWRVTVDWGFGNTPVVSQSSWFAATAIPPDETAPRIYVPASHARRGGRTAVQFRLADNRDTTLLATLRVLHGSRLLLRHAEILHSVSWRFPFAFVFTPPRDAPPGTYRLCVDAMDTSGNSARRCAALYVR